MSRGLKIGSQSVAGRVWLAPMTGVSDLPCRKAQAAQGASYVATEMVAGAELVRGRPDVVRRAAVGEGLPLMVVQLVGRDPAMIGQSAKMAQNAGAQIIDLNFGCPAKEVAGGAQCGSALMRDLDLAGELIAAAVDAVEIPVTVKMRLGWNEASKNAPELAARAQGLGAKAITVHGRTRSQFYTGVADWDAVGAVRREIDVPLIVNGDITDAASAREALDRSGADAVMIGRGAYGKPWLAAQIEAELAGQAFAEPGRDERLAIVVEQLRASLVFYGERLGLKMFRKHLGWYLMAAPWPADASARRLAKARLCQLDCASNVERELASLWLDENERLAA